MKSINIFTMKEIKALKKQLNGEVKGRKIGKLGYILVNKKYSGDGFGHTYEIPSLDIVEPTPEQLIEAGIITAEEYRASLL